MQNQILQNEFCFPIGLYYRSEDATLIKKAFAMYSH